MERKILLWWTGLILVSVFTGYYLFFRQYFPVAPANETESSFPNGSSDLTSVEVLTSLLASEDDDQSAPNELHFPLAINEESLKNLLSPVRIFPNTVHLGTNDLTNSYFFKIHPLLHNRGRPEYNDLDLNHDDYVNANRFQRSIFFETDDQNDEDDKGVSEAWVDDYYLQYDERDYPRECIMPAWTDLHFPVCNIFHESMTQERFSKSESIRYLASGYYRDTFLWKSTVAHSSDGDFVFKRLRFCAEHNFTPSIGDQMRTEALIMERLSASPRITQIYGYCATSLAVEVGKEITKDIVPFVPELQYERGRVPQSDLDELQKLHQTEIYSFNNFTAEEKLDIAIQVAEAVAEMHGFAGSVIVNDDVHPDQWLQVPTATGRRLILNDMNNAGFLKWNPVKQEYCKYYRKFGGDFHAPEEFVGDYVVSVLFFVSFFVECASYPFCIVSV